MHKTWRSNVFRLNPMTSDFREMRGQEHINMQGHNQEKLKTAGSNQDTKTVKTRFQKDMNVIFSRYFC